MLKGKNPKGKINEKITNCLPCLKNEISKEKYRQHLVNYIHLHFNN